jgi:branched-chain amino acid aminotransferase
MIGKKYILDGKLIDVNTQSENIEIKNSIVVYEVFTWENGSAIFFEEHYDRFISSIEFKNLDRLNIPTRKALLSKVNDLAQANSFEKKNIRIDLIFIEGKLQHYAVYFVKSIFPTQVQYKNGVEVSLCFGERENPKAKIANSEIRDKANKKIKEENLLEVLLVNRKNAITEGSRSNVFFVKGDTIYTSKSEGVLSGITRQKVLEIANKLNVEVIETDILLSELSTYESAFLTSTSMVVLPICCIDDIEFSVGNELVGKLYSEFYKS